MKTIGLKRSLLFGSSSGGGGGSPSNGLLANIRFHFKLDESFGNRTDSHSALVLTDVGGVGNAPGKLGNAASFDSSFSQALTSSDDVKYSTGDVDFTLACWVQLSDNGTDRAIIWKGSNSSATVEYALRYDTGDDRFIFRVGNGVTASEVSATSLGGPDLDTWYFIVCWHDADANTLNIQVDNGSVDSVSYSSGSYDSTLGFALGRSGESADYFWDGLIDSVSFWGMVLTSEQRSALYNAGLGLDYESFTSV